MFTLAHIRQKAADALGLFTALQFFLVFGAALYTGNANMPLLATSGLITIIALMLRLSRNEALVANTMAVLLMGQVMLLVAAFRGHVWQIDMHMYFFATLGMLTALISWSAILFATVAVAVHHIVLDLFMPQFLFPGDEASFTRVVVHAVIVLIEAGVLILIARVIEQAFASAALEHDRAAEALARVEAAEDERMALQQRTEHEKQQAMEKLAKEFETAVNGVVAAVTASASEMDNFARQLNTSAQQTTHQVDIVAAASEEAATNVSTVAAATEELSASIQEINRQVGSSASLASNAVAEAASTNQTINGLAEAAQKIGDVVQLISEIANQTNLLALNATIEAARAGEAGKGFAVVASEVKNLATQTAKATEDITAQISGIQGVAHDAVKAIQGISGTIERINSVSASISAAVEQQGNATSEISRNVQQAAAGTKEVSTNISAVTGAAENTGTVAGQVLSGAQRLNTQAQELQKAVEIFLSKVRAA